MTDFVRQKKQVLVYVGQHPDTSVSALVSSGEPWAAQAPVLINHLVRQGALCCTVSDNGIRHYSRRD